MQRSVFTKLGLSFALGLAIASSCARPSLAAHPEPGTVVVLPAGTAVTLVPTGTGGMAGAHNIGDSIDFTVMKPVIVNGWILIPAGAPAHGTVSDLTSPGVRMFAGGFSQASLHFAFD